MARIMYEDDLVTEYDDGTTEVRFTDEEWTHMWQNAAAFGLACERHGTRDWNRDHQWCGVCETGEYDDYEEDER